MTEELFNQIQNELSQVTTKKAEVKKAAWLIFTIGNKLYALPTEQVKEILRDAQVFPLPFVPSYLKGVVNRYGDPYAVIDPAVIIGEPEQKSSIFIVLNNETHSCLQITDVKDFYTTKESEIVPFAQSEMTDYFEGTITFDYEPVLILKANAFIERVGKDIAS